MSVLTNVKKLNPWGGGSSISAQRKSIYDYYQGIISGKIASPGMQQLQRSGNAQLASLASQSNEARGGFAQGMQQQIKRNTAQDIADQRAKDVAAAMQAKAGMTGQIAGEYMKGLGMKMTANTKIPEPGGLLGGGGILGTGLKL